MFESKASGFCDCYCFWCFVVNIIMSKKSVLRFTLKELNALIQDEKARVVLQRSIRKLPLQPYCLSDLRGAIHEALDANLAKFDHELKGILLSYKNIKIVKNVANVLYDDSRLYLTIQADFYLFMPEVGCVLRGIVNKRSADHIGCLVHKAFNVSIPRPECETDEDWQGYYVDIGQEVTFRVESLDLTGSLPYMLGQLINVGSLSSPTSEIFDEQKNEDIVADISKFNGFMKKYEDPDESIPTVEHKKKKKHKKFTDLESRSNVEDTVSVKHEKYDSILEKDDQEHEEYGSIMKTPKKKKRKNTDQIPPIKQEEQRYSIDNERSANYLYQQEEEHPQYEQHVTHNERHIDSSHHLPAVDHLNISVNLKKKKRKYGDAFHDIENDDENHTFSTQNESVIHKKKKRKKEKPIIETSNAHETVEGDFSIAMSQELTNQDKKRKKKKKKDATEEISTEREKFEFHGTDAYGNQTTMDRPLNTSPDSSNTPEELTMEMRFSREHLKKMSKKVKPLETTGLVTSTPVEHKTKKGNNFSDSLSRSKFSTITSPDSHPDLKQTNLFESMDHFSLLHSPIFKHTKKEKEGSLIPSDTAPVKGKKLKKEKRLSSTHQSSDASISDDHQHSVSHHVSHHSESNIPWSDREKLIRDATTHLSPHNKSLTNEQEIEHKNKERDSTEKPKKHLLKDDLESSVERKVKIKKREGRLSIKKRDSFENDAKRTMKRDSNTNNSGDYDDDDDDDDGNNSYGPMIAQCEEYGKGQDSNKLVDCMVNVKKQPSVNRKSFTPPMNARSSLKLAGNVSEEGNSSDEDNMLKSISKLSRTLSSERSPKNSRINAINLSSCQTTKSADRACSPDSGLSLSATSAEKDSNTLTGRGSKGETDFMYSRESPKDGRNKEEAKILPKTPKRKKGTDTEEDSSHLTIKHRIKKEKESPVSKSSILKSDSKSPLRDDDSLEAERMKILAEMIKKLGDGNKEDLSMKDESHKPPSSTAVKAKRQSKQEDTMSDSDLDTSKSKKIHNRKESNKFKGIKSIVGEVDNRQQLGKSSDFKHYAEKLPSSPTVHDEEKELHGNRNSLGEGSPIPIQAKISQKTPRRKSSTGTEGSSSKRLTKTPVKVKEKESPQKRKVISSFECDNKERNFLDEESPGELAERLLNDFLKKKSL